MTAFATQRCEGIGLVERHYATWQEPLSLDGGGTLAPITMSGTAKVDIAGTLGATLDPVTMSAAGAVGVTGPKPN